MEEHEKDFVAALEADLAAIAAADADLERDAEAAERTRIERSGLTMPDRLRACRSSIEVATLGGGRHGGRVLEVGADWFVLTSVVATAMRPGVEHLVPIPSVLAVRGLGRAVDLTRARAPARSMGSLLRSWCRDRSQVGALLVDGSVLAGLASAAYADHLEVSTGGGAVAIVPLLAIAVISR